MFQGLKFTSTHRSTCFVIAVEEIDGHPHHLGLHLSARVIVGWMMLPLIEKIEMRKISKGKIYHLYYETVGGISSADNNYTEILRQIRWFLP